MHKKVTILIADQERLAAKALAAFMETKGFEVRVTNDGDEAQEIVKTWKPRFVLIDLLLPKFNAFQMVRWINEDKPIGDRALDVLIMSGHSSEFNVKQAIQTGAKDYLVKPFDPMTLIQRLYFHSRVRRINNTARKKQQASESELALKQIFLLIQQSVTGEDEANSIFHLTRMAAIRLGGVRSSVVEVLSDREGVVVTSHDNPKASGIRLDLNNYPEIFNVSATMEPLVVENLGKDASWSMILSEVKDIQFNGLVVAPIFTRQGFFGVLSIRIPESDKPVADADVQFVSIAAGVIGLILSPAGPKILTQPWRKTTPAKAK